MCRTLICLLRNASGERPQAYTEIILATEISRVPATSQPVR